MATGTNPSTPPNQTTKPNAPPTISDIISGNKGGSNPSTPPNQTTKPNAPPTISDIVSGNKGSGSSGNNVSTPSLPKPSGSSSGGGSRNRSGSPTYSDLVNSNSSSNVSIPSAPSSSVVSYPSSTSRGSSNRSGAPTYADLANPAVASSTSGGVITQSQAQKAQDRANSLNFSSVSGRSESRTTRKDFVPFQDYTPRIKYSSASEIESALKSGNVYQIPAYVIVSDMPIRDNNGVIIGYKTRNFVTESEYKQIQKQTNTIGSLAPPKKINVYQDEGFFRSGVNNIKAGSKLVGSAVTSGGINLVQAQAEGRLITPDFFGFFGKRAEPKKTALSGTVSDINRLRIVESFFGVSPTVSTKSVQTGLALTGAGFGLEAVPTGATQLAGGTSISLGLGILAPEFAKQRDYERLDENTKRVVQSNRQEVRDLFFSARRAEQTAVKPNLNLFGVGFSTADLPIVPSAYELFGTTKLQSVDSQLSRKKSAFEGASSGKGAVIGSFLQGQRRADIFGQDSSLILQSGASNIISEGAEIAGRKGASTALFRFFGKAGAQEPIILGEQIAKGSVKSVARKTATTGILATSTGGAFEGASNYLIGQTSEQQPINKRDLTINTALGAISSGSVNVPLKYFDVFGTAGKTTAQRAGGKTGYYGTYAVASALSLEEPFGDLFTTSLTSNRAKRPIISFASTPTETTATAGLSSVLGLSQSQSQSQSQSRSQSQTQSRSQTVSQNRSNANSFSFEYGLGNSFNNIFNFNETPSDSTNDTPTDTNTTTDTVTGTITPTNTFQNFFPPVFPSFDLPRGSGGGSTRDRKKYFNELNLALDFGGLNIVPRSQPQKKPVKVPKGEGRNALRLFNNSVGFRL